MSDSITLTRETQNSQVVQDISQIQNNSNQPSLADLQTDMIEASQLVDDIVLKKYLHELSDLDIVPLGDEMQKISDIRIFKITEMVYQSNEYSTYKFASVFNAVQNLNCGVFIIMDSDGKKTDFYMGVRSFDDKRTTKSLKDTLRNALSGQFPGVKTEDLLDPAAEDLLSSIATQNITSISCVAKNKDNEFKDNESFIQGLEKLAIAMQGQKYTVIVLAKSTPSEQLEETKRAYETIYTQLSPYANMQLSYGTNTAISLSDALSHGTTSGTSYSKSTSIQKGTSHQEGVSKSQSISKPDKLATIAKSLGTVALGVASIATAPLTGGASIALAAALTVGHGVISNIAPKTYTDGTSTSSNDTVNKGTSEGENYGTNEGISDNITKTVGQTSGSSNNVQLTMQNKNLIDIMEKINLQLKRIDECESVGMWECAAYILSDTQETAEMAAGTYKAIMKGENSGIETSAINFWGRRKKSQLPILRNYITNFIHPVFEYTSETTCVQVSAASLVSSNELAIHMGLPRKSVCWFPVIEHADFGKEVVRYTTGKRGKDFQLGHVFSMGRETDVNVNLDCDSLTMHTFITGSTGAGKSNAVYEVLSGLRSLYGIPFLVVEPAKGEYKNIFGQFADVKVFGTNPRISNLLKINPFSFPRGVHVLEHMDRLVEIFNVCWPMYAAMPAIMKEAMEKAYISTGWDLSLSENKNGSKFPNFVDLLEQIETVIEESKYSADCKGDYSGALMTRIRSLTTGLNGQIFSNDEIKYQNLFDESVIVDLSRVGSAETKALIMGLLVMKLNEYRMDSGRMNSPLLHVTVLEEAHNLLKRASTEQSSESSNLLGKSVELLTNSIAEMRAYGEGFIIADQSPGLLDMSVIRNTNTKIILRLPEKTDRELVGYAAGLKEVQIPELAKLKRGVAAIYQNDWIEPVLVQINKCEIKEKQYNFLEHNKLADNVSLRRQLIGFMIQGSLDTDFPFDVNEIEGGIDKLGLSVKNEEFVEGLIREYRESGKLVLWEDSNFDELARRLTGILGVRNKVENYVLTAENVKELTRNLEKTVLELVPGVDRKVTLTLSVCFMRDMGMQQDEAEIRQKLYQYWLYSVMKEEYDEQF